MKRLNYIVLGLLTVSLIVLTDKLHLAEMSDKLICTLLWSIYAVITYASYLLQTREWDFKPQLTFGWIVGVAIAIEKTKGYSFSYQIVLPFMVIELAWYKQQEN
tara:strand:- start:9280 stop:9591 length:312 start_codon:yes stop_codon:yes gene_type:complete